MHLLVQHGQKQNNLLPGASAPMEEKMKATQDIITLRVKNLWKLFNFGVISETEREFLFKQAYRSWPLSQKQLNWINNMENRGPHPGILACFKDDFLEQVVHREKLEKEVELKKEVENNIRQEFKALMSKEPTILIQDSEQKGIILFDKITNRKGYKKHEYELVFKNKFGYLTDYTDISILKTIVHAVKGLNINKDLLNISNRIMILVAQRKDTIGISNWKYLKDIKPEIEGRGVFRCVCGKSREVNTYAVLTGRSLSCGCQRRHYSFKIKPYCEEQGLNYSEVNYLLKNNWITEQELLDYTEFTKGKSTETNPLYLW